MSPLESVHDAIDKAKKDLYDATHLKLGLAFTSMTQRLTEAPLGGDKWGIASDLDLLASWDLLNRGKPTQGKVYSHLEGRWDYGTTGPEEFAGGLGIITGTANTFSAYNQGFLVRNLYWQQGSQEAGWAYRFGKITPDATISTSAHIAAPITFLPTTSVGACSNAVADSGLGIVGAWYPHDRLRMLGLISDTNGDREDFGDVGEGDFFKAIELGAKIFPRTPKAGYSKVTLWHTDGTKDREPANGALGPEGWGFFLKYQQELTADGRLIGVARYGRSYEDSAVFEHQADVNLLLYEPAGLGLLGNDLLGLGYSWAKVPFEASSEHNLEVFYRFPLFPLVDVTLSYQSLFHPAFDPDNDQACAFGIRIRTTF